MFNYFYTTMKLFGKSSTKKHILFVFCIVTFGFLLSCGAKSPENNPSVQSQVPPAKSPRADLMVAPDELKNPPQVVVNQSAVDIVNEMVAITATPAEHVFKASTDAPLWIRGWAYDDTNKKTPSPVWIELTGKTNKNRFFIPADRCERKDIATGFKVPWAIQSGVCSKVIRDHNIPRDSYDVKIYQINGSTAELTRFYAVQSYTINVE